MLNSNFFRQLRILLSKEYHYYVRPPNHPLRKGLNGDFIFIHINKTGGTSIAKALGLPHKRHLTVKRILGYVARRHFDRAFKFSVVRNPWSKVLSHYFYLERSDYFDLKSNPISFKEWVVKTHAEEKDPFYYYNPVMFMEQCEWFKDEEGNMCVDKIVHFEALEEGFKEVSQKLGFEVVLPKLNTTKKVNYQDYYDEELKELIAECYKNDIKLFGYTFD